MKRSISLLLFTLMITLFAGCAIGGPKVPEWAAGDEVYAESYLALKEIFAPKQKDPVEEFKFLRYDKDKAIPYLDFSEVDEKEIAKAQEALKKIWDGKNVPMFGAQPDSLEESKVAILRFFSSFNCRSMALSLPFVQIPESWRVNEDDPYDLSGIQGLETLVIDSDDATINTGDGINPCKDVKDLTVPAERVLVNMTECFPETEKLTLVAVDGQTPEYYDIGPKVAEITYTKADGSDVESSREVYNFFKALTELEQVKKINGVEKDQFEIPVSDELKKEIEEEEKAAERQAKIDAEIEKLANYKVDHKEEKGTPKLGKKIIVKCDSSYSFESALDGEAFEGIPAERLAKTYEEADTYLVLHPYHVLVGTYSNGGMAYKTYTMVFTFDLKDGGKEGGHLIGETDPPQTITTYNNIPTGGSGKFLKDEALAYVKKLL